MTGWRRRSERVLAAAMALALQAALYRLLLPPRPSRPEAGNSPPMIAMILTAERPHRTIAALHRPGKPKPPAPLFEHIAVEPITPPKPPTPASRPAIDWEAAMRHEVRAQAVRAGVTRTLRFGFPRMPAHVRAAPEFGWDEARIDRMQRLENGIIDLGDRCVIKLSFPIPICRFGRIPANGDLFKHMDDPRNAQGSLP
ncbi:MAG TPA: hypothetical protein VFN79_06845 [Steroidobacteraceae bacterium]|nr:hypothetical protein [Steroidobacteraceae bacterium]